MQELVNNLHNIAVVLFKKEPQVVQREFGEHGLQFIEFVLHLTCNAHISRRNCSHNAATGRKEGLKRTKEDAQKQRGRYLVKLSAVSA